MLGSRKVNLEFSVNWLLTIIGAAIILVAAYVIWPAWRPVLMFAAPVMGGAGALIAAFNALDSRVSQLQQLKRAVALDLIHRWIRPEFHHAKKSGRDIIKHFREHRNIEEQKTFLADPTRLANVIDVMNAYEAMSIAVRTEMADEEIARRFFQTMVLEYWHVMKDFINARRAEKNNTRLYQEFEWLFNRWKS